MKFTEEDLVHALRNVSEDQSVLGLHLETYRHLQGRNMHLNRQKQILKRDEDHFEDALASMGIIIRPAARSSVSLDPELWSTLPVELLHRLFAHLPLVDIIRLRALSTTWNRYVSGDMPGFTKVCAEMNPRLFGMIGESQVYEDGAMAVMLPGSETSWHTYSCEPPMDGWVDTMRAGDGGLVCIVSLSTSTRHHPRIVVRNPLTCRDRALPPLPNGMRSARLWMVQLVMDRDLKCYKVLVLSLCYTGAIQARVFCSIAGKWRSAKASDGLIFGYRYTWKYDEYEGGPGPDYDDDYKNTESPSGRIPCVYDCARSKLVVLDDESSPWKEPGVLPEGLTDFYPYNDSTYVLVKGRLFVLHKALHTRPMSDQTYNRYWISEYQAQMRRPYWAKLRDHSCGIPDVDTWDEYVMRLYATRNFLLVTARNGREVAHWRIYEIASGKWREMAGDEVEAGDEADLAMFELQWDAVP